jgi:hypothetical protein
MRKLTSSVFFIGSLFLLAPQKAEAGNSALEKDTALTKKSFARSTGTNGNLKPAKKPSPLKIKKQLYRRLPPNQLKKEPGATFQEDLDTKDLIALNY